MGMRTVRRLCSFCSGSGRDPITGAGTCSMCGGLGQRDEQVFVPDGPGGGSGRRAGGGSGGNSDLGLGFAGLLLLAFAVWNYVLTADLYMASRGAYQITRVTDWRAVGLVAAGSLLSVAIAARLYGVLPALLAGALATLPAWQATGGGIGVVYIVFHPDGTTGGSATLAWALAIGATLFHFFVAATLQPGDRTFWRRVATLPEGGFGPWVIGLTLLCLASLIALGVVVSQGLGPFR